MLVVLLSDIELNSSKQCDPLKGFFHIGIDMTITE